MYAHDCGIIYCKPFLTTIPHVVVCRVPGSVEIETHHRVILRLMRTRRVTVGSLFVV